MITKDKGKLMQKQDWEKYRSIFTQLDYEAMERDGWQCVECGKTEGLEVHHKIPSIEKLDNLITLCHRCHKKSHNWSGCFKRGRDERRKVSSDEHMKRIGKKTQFGKGIYFNRWTNEWVGRDA